MPMTLRVWRETASNGMFACGSTHRASFPRGLESVLRPMRRQKRRLPSRQTLPSLPSALQNRRVVKAALTEFPANESITVTQP
jgi:hypothetical protein